MKKSNVLVLFLFSIFIVYSLINIKETNASTMEVLTTFSKTILPALLTFLILNQMLIKLGIIDLLAYFFQYISYPLFKISGKGASIIIIGLLNGFPSSAIFTSIMLINKQIEKQEAQRIINSIFFPSISFLFAILRQNMNNSYYFTLLTLCLYLVGFTFLYFSSFKVKNEQKLITFKQTLDDIKNKLNSFIFAKDVKEIISYSFNTLFNILGIITLFSIPCNIVEKIINGTYSFLFKGLIEFSIPSIQLSLLNENKKMIVVLLSSILSFSGLSSLLQATLFIDDANLSTKQFITNRILISLCTTILLLLFLSFL